MSNFQQYLENARKGEKNLQNLISKLESIEKQNDEITDKALLNKIKKIINKNVLDKMKITPSNILQKLNQMNLDDDY